MPRRLIDAEKLKKHYAWWDDDERRTLFDQIVDAQPTIDAEPHWIPCSERLPEDDRSKVVTLANGNAEVGYYSNGDWWCVGDSFRLENPTVIAWMPLPDPYEVENDEIH